MQVSLQGDHSIVKLLFANKMGWGKPTLIQIPADKWQEVLREREIRRQALQKYASESEVLSTAEDMKQQFTV